MSTGPEHTYRRTPVGKQLVEAIDAIWQEGIAHGLRPDDTPTLFTKPEQQREYENIRCKALAVGAAIREAVKKEDGTGQYDETERLLGELKVAVEKYLRLVLPRLAEMLEACRVSRRCWRPAPRHLARAARP